MTYEQTREIFLRILNENAYTHLCEPSDIKNAIDALDKQIPKKPISNKVKVGKVKVGNGWWCKGTTIHKCPICDEYATRTSKYCNQCGQALDWSDT